MVKIPSCTIYYILSLHKIMDTLFKTKNNRCLLQQRLFKNFSSLLHFALDFQIIFGFQFFIKYFLIIFLYNINYWLWLMYRNLIFVNIFKSIYNLYKSLSIFQNSQNKNFLKQ